MLLSSLLLVYNSLLLSHYIAPYYKNIEQTVFFNIKPKKKIKDLFVLQNGSKYRTSEYGQGHDILLSSCRGTLGV